jgi:hypothetical protein
VGPLTETQQGNRYVLTFQDELSKYLIAIPIARQDSETVAKEFVKNIVLRVGTPDKILTDQGSNFLSDVFRNTCKMLKIKKLQTTPFHPETNGGLERSHRVLKEYLRHYINEDQTNWDEWIPYSVYAYNTSIHTATGYTPFELVYGFKATMPSVLQGNPSVQYNYEDFLMEIKNRLQTAHSVARERLVNAKMKSKEYYDKAARESTLRVGDRVLLYDETVRRGRSKKVSSQWLGPFEIIDLDKVNATIKRGTRTQKVHLNRLKPFY